MTDKLYLIFFPVYLLLIMVNYNLLKNPKPYPPEEIREELKSGRERLNYYKYIGLSHYLIPMLVKSQENWIRGNDYWYKSGIRLGIIGLFLTSITTVMVEVFGLFDSLIGLFIIFIPSFSGLIFLCIRMEKDILMD